MSRATAHRLKSAPESDTGLKHMPEAAVRALEALAAEPAGKPGPARADRRGPMRPGRLSPLRQRLSGAATARMFRYIDWIVLAAATFLVSAAFHPEGLMQAPVGDVLPLILGLGVIAGSLESFGAYDFGPREGLTTHLARTAAGLLPCGAALLLWAWLARPPASVTTAALFCLSLALTLTYGLHAAWWTQVRRWRASGRLTPNIVVVGATRHAERLVERLIATREANVLGVFDDRLGRAPGDVKGVPVLGDTQALLGHRIMPYVDRIVVAVPTAAQGRVRQMMERLRVLPNDVALFLDVADDREQSAAISRLADAPLAQLSGAPRDERRAAAKRLQDLVIGVLCLIPGIPIMALIALAVRLDSPGPIFFRQRRHGFNNEEIVVWKFRSMRHETADATASRQVEADDARITRVGRFIRQSSLDELPQIFNVLKGEMSLVGPRPHAIGMKTGETESARLVAEYAHRHRIKPGLTGWAAIKGSRGPVETAEKVRRRVALDVEYIERQSFWLDLYILAMTLPCLLGDRAGVR